MRTWCDFKRAVEATGVKDDDVLAWIDYVAPGTVRVIPTTIGVPVGSRSYLIDYAEKHP